MTVAIGVVLAVNSLLVAVALSVGRQLFIDALSDTEFGPGQHRSSTTRCCPS